MSATAKNPLEAHASLLNSTAAEPECPRVGIEFGRALCRHLGLDSRDVSDEIRIRTGRDDIFSVDLNIFLTPGDLQAIGAIMAERPAGAGARSPAIDRTPPLYDPVTGTARFPWEASASAADASQGEQGHSVTAQP